MRAEVLRHGLAENRRSTIWWFVGIAAFMVVNVATWPAIEGQEAYDDLLDDMPEAMMALFGIEPGMSITSPTGFLISQVFGFLLPLLLMILAVVVSSRTIAGEEEKHTLDLLVAHPIDRRRLVAEKLAVSMIVVIVVGVASFVVLVVSCEVVDLPAGVGDMAVATGADVLFGLQTGALAFAIGAATGRRALAIAGATALAIGGVVIESLAELSDAIARVRGLFPFHYVNGNIPMLHGLRGLDLAVLVGATVVAAAVAFVTFERRDLH